MKFNLANTYYSGIALPVSSLHGKSSCGCGEFSDLDLLGSWCAETGLSIIQILPVNDTGTNPSPYSALSSMALNPIYIKLDDVEGSQLLSDEIDVFRKLHEKLSHIEYLKTYEFKTKILEKIFKSKYSSIIKDPGFLNWIDRNSWVKNFAAFKILSEINRSIVWNNWTIDPVFKTANEKIPDSVRESRLDEFLKLQSESFYLHTWIQFELEKQLKKASLKLNNAGIRLKGDLPILMDRGSCDVWYHREYFNLSYMAGAPPDAFSEQGQNWGFPVYNREVMAADDFHWWKRRISRFNSFYHAVRLDHVIGFMRLWQVPSYEAGASLGYFSPAEYMLKSKLQELNFSDDEINCLCSPLVDHIFLKNLTEENTIEYIKRTYLSIKGSFYSLNENLGNEKSILALSEPESMINILLKIYRCRALIQIKESTEEFAPAWSFRSSVFYQYLPQDKKNIFETLVHSIGTGSEKTWYQEGKEFLTHLISASDGIFCGEDLGAVPSVTAKLLEELNVFSLKVLRWTRKYDEPYAPFIAIKTYPYLSVATTSVHDSENIRQWWESDQDGRNKLCKLIYHEEENRPDLPADLNCDRAYDLLKWFFHGSSQIVIIPIQDLFSTEERYRIEKPSEERINIPGQVTDTNWTYRLPCSLESLIADKEYIKKISSLTEIRNRGRQAPPVSN